MDDVWNYHAAASDLRTDECFHRRVNKRYGAATSLEDYERKEQAVAYDANVRCFESYGRNKYMPLV